MVIPPSTLEEVARLRSLMNSRTLSSDSDQSQAHNYKLGPEATKVKNLTTKIHTYALNPELPQLLHSDPTIFLEILDALTQLKDLDISQSARFMMTSFEFFLSQCSKISNV